MAKQSSSKGIQFPSKDSPNFFKISISTYKIEEESRKGDTKLANSKKQITLTNTVILPMPNQIGDMQGHNWAEYSITDSIQEYASAVSNFMPTNGLAQKLANGVGDVLSTQSVPNKLARRTTGVGLDPNTRLEYTGEALRDFAFNFTLLPESIEDANAILGIIKFFRINGTGISGAGKGGGGVMASVGEALESSAGDVHAFITEPNTFLINFINPHLNNMLMPIDCVLTGFTTSYFEGGYAAFFEDGMPKTVTIGLTFKEKYTLYSQDWAKSVGS
jgi:hypothetical protein